MSAVPIAQDRRVEDSKITDLSERINGLTAQHAVLAERLAHNTAQNADIAAGLATNTAMTQKIEASTSGLVDAWEAISGGLKVLNFLGKVAKWVTYIAGMVTAVWAAWHMRDSGGPPA